MDMNKDINFTYYTFDLDLFEGGIEKYDLEATRNIIAKGARRLQDESDLSDGVMMLLRSGYALVWFDDRLQEVKGGQES
jgi:hypothetical protein